MNIEDIYKLIGDEFAFIEDLGFGTPTFSVMHTQLIKWMATAEYARPNHGRLIRVTISSPRVDGMMPMVIHISNGDDSFSVSDWLKQAKGPSAPAFIAPCVSEADIQRAVGTLARRAEPLLRVDLKDVLDGAAWPKVAFDWGDYR